MDKIQFLNSILSDIGNFALVIFGFSVTLFTVLYSFVLTKKEQLIEYSDKIKKNEQDPLLFKRYSNIIKQIASLKRLNFHLIIEISTNFVLYFICLLVKYMTIKDCLKSDFTFIIALITFLIAIYVIVLLVITFRDYNRSTKI